MGTAPARPKRLRGTNYKAVRARFLELNETRLSRAREVLKLHQRLFLDVLPLLFHVNHPALPGYHSQQAPCGIDGYKPDSKIITRAKRQLASSFDYTRPQGPASIDSLFIMGSCGSIGQSPDSDLDIWVCHASTLDDGERQLLLEKATRISAWGESLGLEVHCFLMDSAEFRRGERAALNVEACGSSQHFLLLDEFYRTGLLLAGREPTWWAIPPDQEQDYDEARESMLGRLWSRHLRSIDFGGIAFIPPGEYVGAGIWQLYKAIHNPYKSLLKLMLTEVYANDYPGGESLALAYKRAVYAGDSDPDLLDPYIVIYRKLESYLTSRGERERLELVRRCLYFKIGLKLSQISQDNGEQDWRYPLIKQLVEEWGWQAEQLINLDTRQQWRARRVQEEHRFLVKELTDSYRLMLDFARSTHSDALINSEEMTVLGRKLYAAFERKSGKVERLNSSIATDLREEDLSFYFLGDSSDDERWCVFAGLPENGKMDSRFSLKKSDGLLSLLCWCHYNRLIGPGTRVHLASSQARISETELMRLSEFIGEHLPLQQLAARLDEHQAFTQPKHLERILLTVKSDRWSGSNHHAHPTASNIAIASINSWGEVLTQRFSGPSSVMATLRTLLRMHPPRLNDAPPDIRLSCYSDQLSSETEARIQQQLNDVFNCYYGKTNNRWARYVLALGETFYILQPQEHDIDVMSCDTYTDLVQLLGRSQPHYSPIYLDRHCAANSALSAILKRRQHRSLQAFIYRRDDFADIFVSDERGSLFHSPTPYRDFAAMTYALDRFLLSLRAQNNEPEYYQLESRQGQWMSRDLAVDQSHKPQLEISATVADIDGSLLVTAIEFEGNTFHRSRLGDNFYITVAKAMAANDTEKLWRYPCYVTEMRHDSPPGQWQSLHYLLCKQQLEEVLNTELLSVAAAPA